MNNPPYILEEAFGDILPKIITAPQIAAMLTAQTLSTINYQFGPVEELIQTLEQMDRLETAEPEKFPLIWLVDQYKIRRTEPEWFGETINLQIFIIMQTSVDYKAKERLEKVFKPVLFPIYSELLNQIHLNSDVFNSPVLGAIGHDVEFHYFFGDADNNKLILNDIVDIIQISNLQLKVNNNINCDVRPIPKGRFVM